MKWRRYRVVEEEVEEEKNSAAKCRKILLSTLPLKSDDDDGFVKKIEKFVCAAAPFL